MKKKLLVLALLFGLSACNVSNQSTTPTENNEQTTPSEVENNNVVKYTITFASNGGTGSMDSVQVEEGADFTLPLSEFTVPEGQEFIGWRVNGEGDILVPGAKIKVNGNIILVAQWRVVETNNNGGENTNEPEPTEQEPTEPEQKVEYTISFSSNGGTGSMDQEEAEENTNFTLPSNGFTSPKDHDFIGWKINDEGDLLQPGASITITGNIILVAQWQENISNISVRNVYFGDYSGGDAYLEEIEKKFDVKLNISSYDYSNWEQQVIGSINGGSLSDVFHANISSANFGSTYKRWAEEEIIKPLPDDLSKWPNIKSLIEHTSNVNYLKIDGKLYGIPVSRNVVDYSKTFSSYTYIYRRDWAKQWSVYQENDIYTWEQFQNLLATFKAHLENGSCPLADAEWGYPSVANFYKTAPGCYAQNTEGHYVNNYFTNEYIEGLNVAKTFLNNGWSHPDQYSFSDGQASTAYRSNRVGVFYENLSYTNYVSLRKELRKTNASNTNFNLDDATAIMKVKGPDGKYVLEGAENWFSMTMFDNTISNNKLEKILDILDWLLSEEGTRFAVYGIENFDYTMVNGQPVLIEENWPQNPDGNYLNKVNGARYLRYTVSLGLETYEYDPTTDKTALSILNDWESEMKTAFTNNQLKVLIENPEVAWLTTQLKSQYSAYLQNDGFINSMKYIYGRYNSINEYKNAFNVHWPLVLDEINTALGK